MFYTKWLDLPINTRHEIARIFKIEKKLPTHVQDNNIVSDGYNVRDIESALNIYSMQDFLGSDEKDVSVLFNMLVNKIHGIPEPEITEQPLEVKIQKPNAKKTNKK